MASAAGPAQHPAGLEWSVHLSIGGMTCASCSGAIEQMLRATTEPTIQSADVNLMAATAAVKLLSPLESRDAAVQRIVDSIEDIGFEATALRTVAAAGAARQASITVSGMMCTSCSGSVEQALRALPHVVSADVNLIGEVAYVRFVSPGTADDLVEAIEAIGFDASVLTCSGGSIELVQFALPEEGEARAFEEALRKINGVGEVTINQNIATVGADFGVAPPRRILDELAALGLNASLAEGAEVSQAVRRSMEAGAWRQRFLISFTLTVPLTAVMLLAMFSPSAQRAMMFGPLDIGSLLMWAFSTPVQFGPGMVFVRDALTGLKRRTIGMAFLIAVGTSVAYISSVAAIGTN
jgi:Cu+-exporting ATPase